MIAIYTVHYKYAKQVHDDIYRALMVIGFDGDFIVDAHKEWSVVELVIWELTVTRIGGVRRHSTRELTVQRPQLRCL